MHQMISTPCFLLNKNVICIQHFFPNYIQDCLPVFYAFQQFHLSHNSKFMSLLSITFRICPVWRCSWAICSCFRLKQTVLAYHYHHWDLITSGLTSQVYLLLGIRFQQENIIHRFPASKFSTSQLVTCLKDRSRYLRKVGYFDPIIPEHFALTTFGHLKFNFELH